VIQFNNAWAARRRRLWTRNNAYLWLRPDHARFLPPELKAGFNPEQPRIPAGEEGAGQWTSADAENTDESADPTGSDLLDEFGAANRGGHHFVPRGVFRNLSLSPDALSVFEGATTGPLQAGVHRWSREHLDYSRAVGAQLNRFMELNGIRPDGMTSDQAKTFVDSIRRSSEPAIRDFNLNIYRRELRYLLRFGPRRLD
jgi:hypothetical protein